MIKRIFVLIAIKVTFSVLAIIAFAGCSTTAIANKEKISFIGNVGEISIKEKDFVILGRIFLTSSAIIDENGFIIDGSPITYEMLWKEAQKLGADEIVNLKIDEILKLTEYQRLRLEHIDYQYSIATASQKIISKREITYNATALAIKYTD